MAITIICYDGAVLFPGAGLRVKIASYDPMQILAIPAQVQHMSDAPREGAFVIWHGSPTNAPLVIADLIAAIVNGDELFDMKSWTPP